MYYQLKLNLNPLFVICEIVCSTFIQAGVFIMATQKNPSPPPWQFLKFFPVFCGLFLAAYNKEGNKLKIFSLFFTNIPFFSSLFPPFFFYLYPLFFPFIFFFSLPQFFPLNSSIFFIFFLVNFLTQSRMGGGDGQNIHISLYLGKQIVVRCSTPEPLKNTRFLSPA